MLATALVATFTLFATAVPVAAEGASPQSDAAISWMDRELTTNGGTLPGWVEGTVDWGLMGDFALSRIATGHGAEPATGELAQRLLDNLAAYSTWDDQDGKPGVRSAGALAKVYLVALGAGLDTTDVGGVDLETEMRSLMMTTGDQAGRFADRNPYGPDYSLGLGQSWAMMALEHTADGVPGEAVTFLASQQCPAGGFRLVYEGTSGCDDDAEADPDSTALAIQVFLGMQRSADLEKVVTEAADWLAERQLPDGSFGGGRYTEAPNANSTGVIAQTLRALGRTGSADAAAAWIGDLQLGEDSTGTPAAGDTGAIAYDPTKVSAALKTGIADAGRDQWRRATAQGVLALGAGLLVEIVDPPDGDSATSTTSTTSTTTTTTTPTTTVSPGTGSGEQKPTSETGATAEPSGVEVAGESATAGSPTGAASSGAALSSGGASSNASAATTNLASTGTESTSLALVALAIMCLGAVVVGLGSRLTRRGGDSVAR